MTSEMPTPEINWQELISELENGISSTPEQVVEEEDLLSGTRSLGVVHLAESALNNFGINPKAVEEILALSRGEADRMKPICICGHGVSRHMSFSEGSDPYCSVGKGYCACRKPLPAIKVSDSRSFMYRTDGWGIRHALIKGIRAFEQKGGRVTMIIEPYCVFCKRSDGTLLPAPINRHNKIVMTPQQYTIIVCPECLEANR